MLSIKVVVRIISCFVMVIFSIYFGNRKVHENCRFQSDALSGFSTL
jgi:hypothetical protein